MMVALAGTLAAQDATTQDKTSETTLERTSATVAAQTSESAAPAAVPGDSHVRIVRLSEAQGTLGMDRGTGKGYEQTMQNMPIVEGAKLQTDDGYAEVEFEDGSTLRLTPDSRVVFSQLVLHGTGVKGTAVSVERGTVYVNLENSKDNEFAVRAGQASMAIAPGTHMRLEITWPKMVVSVYGGNVTVQSGGATTAVTKKQSATLDATDASKVDVTKKIAEATYDGWDKESNEYHSRYAKGNAFAGGGYSYGLSDLNYYGNFVDGGCGMMWQPYFTSAAWSPYANGSWAWYPGAGYSWVSPYPWGWLPYHTGSWSFCQGMGWGWQPGGAWRGLANYSAGIAGPGVGAAGTALPGRNGLLPTPPAGPVRGPVAPASTLVMSNARPLVMSKESQAGNFVFQKDSAGMGVPRGSLGGLKGVSNDVAHHGTANMQVYADPMATSPRGMNNGAHPMNNSPVTLRQASPGSMNNAGGMNNNAAGWRGPNAGAQPNGGANNSAASMHNSGGGGGSYSGGASHSGGGGSMSGGGNSGGSSGSNSSSGGGHK